MIVTKAIPAMTGTASARAGPATTKAPTDASASTTVRTRPTGIVRSDQVGVARVGRSPAITGPPRLVADQAAGAKLTCDGIARSPTRRARRRYCPRHDQSAPCLAVAVGRIDRLHVCRLPGAAHGPAPASGP